MPSVEPCRWSCGLQRFICLSLAWQWRRCLDAVGPCRTCLSVGLRDCMESQRKALNQNAISWRQLYHPLNCPLTRLRVRVRSVAATNTSPADSWLHGMTWQTDIISCLIATNHQSSHVLLYKTIIQDDLSLVTFTAYPTPVSKQLNKNLRMCWDSRYIVSLLTPSTAERESVKIYA
jgi:hypothetical protein